MTRAFSHCPTCKFEYETEDRDEGHDSRYMRFRCLVLRDTFKVLLMRGAQGQLARKKTFLTHVQLLSMLDEKELETVAETFEYVSVVL